MNTTKATGVQIPIAIKINTNCTRKKSKSRTKGHRATYTKKTGRTRSKTEDLMSEEWYGKRRHLRVTHANSVEQKRGGAHVRGMKHKKLETSSKSGAHGVVSGCVERTPSLAQ